MVRKYNRKTGQQSWNKDSMLRAIEAVQNKEMSCQKAAASFNVPRSTLQRRVKITKKGEKPVIKLGRFVKTFTSDQEEDFKKHLLDMDKRFFGLTTTEFRRVIFQYAEMKSIPHKFNHETGIAGEFWYLNFMKNQKTLALRSPESTSFARAAGFNKPNVNKFFDLLESLVDKYNFPPSRIFNVDETGISTVPTSNAKIISEKGKRQVGAIASAERGVTTTAAICCNAAGFFVPPLLIFPRVKTDLSLGNGCPPETKLVFHKSGWMQTEIFYPTWFEYFKRYANPTADNPVLLILDGHSTHVKNLDLVLAAKESNVQILCIPPHTSHKLQPLDLTFMKPLKTYHAQECKTWLRSHPGQIHNLRTVGEMFGRAYMRAATPQNAIKGFASAGIYPFNRHIFPDEEFAASITTDIPLEQPQADASISNEAPDQSIQKECVYNETPRQSSTSEISMIKDKAEITLEDILPIPKVQYSGKIRQSSNRREKTAIITSSSYLQELKQNKMEQNEKLSEKVKKNMKNLNFDDGTKKPTANRKQQSNSQSKKPGASKENQDDVGKPRASQKRKRNISDKKNSRANKKAKA